MPLEIKNVRVFFGDFPLKKPFRISSGTIKTVPQMFVEVGVACGKNIVKGFGHNSIGVLWADRRKLSLKVREEDIKECAKMVASKLRCFGFSSPFDFYDEFVIRNGTRLPNLAYVMALSPIDLALWDSYAKLKGRNVFALQEVKTRMDYQRPQRVRVAHLVGMDDPIGSVIGAIGHEGISCFKVKLGGRPDIDAAKVNRVAEIAGVSKLTADANEAYASPAELGHFVGRLGKTAFRKLLLIEQPFLRDSAVNIRDGGMSIPVFADESAVIHSDIKQLRDMGYSGVALKPHSKTFSGTLLCLDELRRRGMSWTIMDLTTAPPIGYVAGLGCGSMLKAAGGTELNGRQYYKNWTDLFSIGPAAREKFSGIKGGFANAAAFLQGTGWGIDESAFRRYLTAAGARQYC